jgi:hypothetical protein
LFLVLMNAEILGWQIGTLPGDKWAQPIFAQVRSS